MWVLNGSRIFYKLCKNKRKLKSVESLTKISMSVWFQEVESEGVEIIFVSSDRSPADMVSYMKESHGDWYGVEHGSDLAQGLKQKFGVSGIPCLVVIKSDGTLITKDGRGAVQGKGPAAVKDWKWISILC